MFLTAVRSAAGRHLAACSVAASVALAALKLEVSGSSGSVALYGSALDEVFDIAVIGMTVVVARHAAARNGPADGASGGAPGRRAERLGVLAQTPLLVAAGGVVAYMAAAQLTGGAMTMRMQAAPVAIATLLLSAGVDLWRAVALTRAARRSGSATLAAAALNFRMDVCTTAVALLGLATVGTGWQAADPVAALLIGVVMIGSAARLAWDAGRARDG